MTDTDIDTDHYDRYMKYKQDYLNLKLTQMGGASSNHLGKCPSTGGKQKYCYSPKEGDRCRLSDKKPDTKSGNIPCDCKKDKRNKQGFRCSKIPEKGRELKSESASESSSEPSSDSESEMHSHPHGCDDKDCSRTQGAKCGHKKTCSCACHKKIKIVRDTLSVKYPEAVELLNAQHWDVDKTIHHALDQSDPKKTPEKPPKVKKDKEVQSFIPTKRPELFERAWNETETDTPEERAKKADLLDNPNIQDFDIVLNTNQSGYRNTGKYIYYKGGLHTLSSSPDDYGSLPDFVKVRKEDCGKSYFRDFLIDHNTYVPFKCSEWTVVNYSIEDQERRPFRYFYKEIHVKIELKRLEDDAVCFVLAPITILAPSAGGPDHAFRKIGSGSDSDGNTYEILRYANNTEVRLQKKWNDSDNRFEFNEPSLNDIKEIIISDTIMNKAIDLVRQYFEKSWKNPSSSNGVVYLQMIGVMDDQLKCHFDLTYSTGLEEHYGDMIGIVAVEDKDVIRKKTALSSLSELEKRLQALRRQDSVEQEYGSKEAVNRAKKLRQTDESSEEEESGEEEEESDDDSQHLEI